MKDHHDEWSHNRVFLLPMNATHWMVLMANDDRYVASFSSFSRVMRVTSPLERAQLQGLMRENHEETRRQRTTSGWCMTTDGSDVSTGKERFSRFLRMACLLLLACEPCSRAPIHRPNEIVDLEEVVVVNEFTLTVPEISRRRVRQRGCREWLQI